MLELKDFIQLSCFKILKIKHLTSQFVEKAEHQTRTNSLVDYKRGTISLSTTNSVSQTCSISFNEISPTSRFN